jgi:hypothetical protein
VPTHRRAIVVLFNYKNGSKLSVLGLMKHNTLAEKALDTRLILKVHIIEITIIGIVRRGC